MSYMYIWPENINETTVKYGQEQATSLERYTL